jgi:hypothetical protein
MLPAENKVARHDQEISDQYLFEKISDREFTAIMREWIC